MLLSLLLLSMAAVDPSAAEFEKRLIADVQKGVAAWTKAYEGIRAKNDKRAAEGYSLSAMADLHLKTRDPKLLDEAKLNMMWMVKMGEPIAGFHVTSFIQAFEWLRREKALTAAEQQQVGELIAKTMRGEYSLPDWGAHNRSVVMATGYYSAARALPDHPEAAQWKRWADSLMSESWKRWSVEDASMYQSFWFFHMIEGAEASGREREFFEAIPTRYYFEYYSHMLTPTDLMPDFGDAEWYGLSEWYYADMVRGAAWYRNGRYLEHARRFYSTQADGKTLSGVALYCAGKALRWLDTTVRPEPLMLTKSEEVLDDLVGKKVAFRNDKGRDSTFVLLNYKDQGPYGRYTRDHLDQVLAAYEEKPHHGHADENSINTFMDGQTLLLGDGGYRPADYFGGWRADVFHNRVVAREGWPMRTDVFDFLVANKLYRAVETEKLHFQSFGAIDYSRTRVKDSMLGYTGDRIVVFVPKTGMAIVVDSLRVDKGGHRVFANVWHPENVLKRGEGYVVSWPKKVTWRYQDWMNAHNRDLLIQFLERKDRPEDVKTITRRYGDSQVFYQYLANRWFEGQFLTFVTVLRPHAAGSFNEAMLKDVSVIDSDGRTLGLRFQIDGRPVTVGLKLDRTIGLANYRGRPQWDMAAGMVEYGPLKTDADFAYAWESGAGTDFGFMYGTRVELGGRELFQAPVAPAEYYQGPYEDRPVAEPRLKVPVWQQVVK